MAPHSSTLAWKIPWTEEPGRLQPMGSLRVGHDSVTSLSIFTFMHWRRKWQPTPIFLPGEFHGQRTLVDYSPRGRKESDTTEQLHFRFHFPYHFPQWLYQFTSPPTVQEHSLFSTPSPAFIFCRLFDDGHSDQCMVIYHCSFDFHFSNNERC